MQVCDNQGNVIVVTLWGSQRSTQLLTEKNYCVKTCQIFFYYYISMLVCFLAKENLINMEPERSWQVFVFCF